jgi:hypothetical protein
MAIAVDATRTESVRTATTDPYTFNYTPTSTPRGIVLCAIHSDSSTDHISSVTYGGVAMARAVTAADTTTEPGRADIWWLGRGVPTSTQTVSVDLTSATTDDIQFVVFGLTGAKNIDLVDTDKIEVNTTNPSLTLQYAGRTCVAVSAFYFGGSSAPTPNANMTSLHTHDFTAQFGDVSVQTTPGTSDFVVSYTADDDTGLAVAAFSEVLEVLTGTANMAFTTAAARSYEQMPSVVMAPMRSY